MEGNYCYKYPHPAVTADCVVFVKEGDDLKVLLIERKHDPCKGCWAFPGGFMNIDETTEAAAKRELQEETGLVVDSVEQIGAYSKVDRDPRERVITVAYYTVLDSVKDVCGQDDAKQARWFSIKQLPKLAFDHEEILQKALELLKRR